MTRSEFDRLFEKDNNNRFVRLVIPAFKDAPEMNLIGKDPSEYSVDEIIRLKTYRRQLRESIEE